MSLSIGTVPPAPSSNGPGPGAAAARSSGLPFDAMLDSQTDANDDEAGDVRDADPPADLPAIGVAARHNSRAPVDPVTGSLTGLPGGIRRFLVGNDEHNQDEAVLTAIAKNKPANEAAALLLFAVQDVVQRLESLEAPEGIGQAKSGSSKIPAGLAVDDQVLQNLLSALVDAEATSAEAEAAAGAPTPATASTFVTDQLTKEWSQAGQSDQWRALDAPFSRPASMPPVAALVEAIRLATAQGTFADQDQGFNQSSTSMGSDRRSSKGTAALAIHMAEAGAGFDSAVKSSTSSVATAPPLPNEAGVVSSIVQTMRLQLREGVGTAVVHLEPDYLGAVSIALRVENGVVTASLHAENPQVRAWMEANESQLRESLAGQGLTLDRLLVTDERIGEERSDRRHQQEQEQHARQRPRRDDGTTFEVVV